MKAHHACLVGFFGIFSVLAAACSGDDDAGDGAASAIAFEAEAEPLRGFAFDTGLVPKGSPAQVSLKLSAGGKVKVTSSGRAGGDGLGGVPGSGKLALDLHVKMDGRLKIDSTLKKVDSDLPGLTDVDIPVKGAIAFDPFLLESADAADVAAVGVLLF